MADLAEWVLALGTIVTVILMYQQNRILARQGPPTATKRWPKMSRHWPLFIMGIMLVFTWVIFGYDIYNRHHNVALSNYELDQQWGTYHFTEVWNQSFENETVPLDGYSYRNCKFTSVHWTYNGTAPFHIDGTFLGQNSIDSENPPVKMTIIFLGNMFKQTGKPVRMDFRPFLPTPATQGHDR